jgi:hypothetical protein
MIASAVLLVMLGGQAAPDVPPREREVLLELFAATRGASWKDKAGWATTAPVCDWFGVQCDFIDGDAARPTVVGLALSFNDLEGTLPNSIAELTHLQFFAAPGNRLRGDFPERLLERWDQHRFELNIAGSQFDNLVARAVVTYEASGVLCSETDDLRYRLEIDAATRRAAFQSVRCANPKTRRTYCLVREGTSLELARFSRALNRSGFWTLAPDYSFPFTFTTHGVYLTTEVETGGGAKHSVRTYSRQGPLSAWEAQQLFLGLGADVSWTVERRQPRCDFE